MLIPIPICLHCSSSVISSGDICKCTQPWAIASLLEPFNDQCNKTTCLTSVVTCFDFRYWTVSIPVLLSLWIKILWTNSLLDSSYQTEKHIGTNGLSSNKKFSNRMCGFGDLNQFSAKFSYIFGRNLAISETHSNHQLAPSTGWVLGYHCSVPAIGLFYLSCIHNWHSAYNKWGKVYDFVNLFRTLWHIHHIRWVWEFSPTTFCSSQLYLLSQFILSA